MADHNQGEKRSFRDTLNLPRTDFPIRANAAIDDPLMIQRWDHEHLYKKTYYIHEGNEKFILHDGPPYANGHIHLGTAYNKILKDVMAKSQRMMGKHVPVRPGWDCHGLPIELHVIKEDPGLASSQLKNACRAYAQKWVNIQAEEFKQLGVLMRWDHPYLTMDFSYEASIIRAFGIFLAGGFIERKNKTVPWCSSCQTVLALAEIEYRERKDPSIYVLFPLEQEKANNLFPQLHGHTINLLIWTTTPWTLPLNRAVLLRPNTEYVVIDVNGIFVIVGKQLVDTICTLLGVEKKIVAEISSQKMVTQKLYVQHPLIDGLKVPVLVDASVSLEEGTACVHCAPGCGPQDYDVGIKNALEIFSPISPDGRYTIGIKPAELEGMSIIDAQGWVLKKLSEKGALLFKTTIHHSYPHCWRCRSGLIFRATKQWFCDLSQHNLRHQVLNELKTINSLPEKSINYLRAALEGRLEWCLSRQRVWGVPIPALLCDQCDYTYYTQDLCDRIAQGVAQSGTEYWDTVAIADLVPKDFICPSCNGRSFIKEKDILDVWFDSGVSHFAVLKQDKELRFPADVYVEGKDQHRGWFQSSLLTSKVLEGQACMRTLITHGYTVDSKGQKMSKSIGNVVVPSEMIEKLGTDGLRLWVTTIDYASDAVVSNVLLRNVQEVFRKIRNTNRFLLSNLYDFNIDHDALAFEKILMIDRYALQKLFDINQTIIKHYVRYDFTAVFHALADYCASDLSSFYLDIIKDRLYVESSHGILRRSAQTVCWHILDTLTRLMAPILSFTAEQISDHYQADKVASIHLQQFVSLLNVWKLISGVSEEESNSVYCGNIKLLEKTPYMIKKEQQWVLLKDIRSAILKAIEKLREQGLIKHSLEARVTLYFDMSSEALMLLRQFFEIFGESSQTIDQFLKEFFIVSQLEIMNSHQGLEPSELAGLFVKVEKARGEKCPRCWQWEEGGRENQLCKRCQSVLLHVAKK